MNIIKKLITVLLFAMLLNACDTERVLNVDPSISVSIDQAFADPEVFESYVIGIYDELSDPGYLPRLLPWSDVRSGDALVIPTNNFGRYPIEYNFRENPNSAYGSDDLWFQGYDIIGLSNPALAAIADAPLSDANKALFEAELLAFRAKAYHDLVRVFALPYSAGRDNPGVVLNTEEKTPTDPPLGRSTVGEVYDQMVLDLERAESLMPESRTDIFLWTKKSIQGMLARVHLDMGNWAEASAAAQRAFSGVQLMSQAEYAAGFDEPTSEWLLAGGVTADDSNGFLSVHSFWDTRRLGYSSLRLDITFMDDNFTATDIRGYPLLRQAGGSPIVNTGYVSNKWEHNPNFNQDEMFMRASEMYLIAAEAEARDPQGDVGLAQDFLFEIQSRADVNAVRSGNTGQALIDEIILERRKELYAEGHAYFDLQRLQKDLVRTPAGGHYADPLNIPFNDFRRLSPIPQFELDANDVIRDEQNPGYGS